MQPWICAAARVYRVEMAHYLFNDRGGDVARTSRVLRSGWWPVDAAEPHQESLSSGDLVLLYVAAPLQVFIGRAALASVVQDQRSSKGSDPAADTGLGVALTDVEEWDPPVEMHEVLARIDRAAGARADFEAGVVRITEAEYAAALTVAGEQSPG